MTWFLYCASMNSYQISSFYKFKNLPKEDLQNIKKSLEKKAKELHVRGLFLIGQEGFNATISGKPEDCQEFKTFLQTETPIGEMVFKDSYAEYMPFRAFKVKIKKEIVTIGDTNVVPKSAKLRHISPKEWQDILVHDKDAIVLDTRNWYETEIGKFHKAIDMKINEFNEFPQKLNELNLAKDKKILIYCTGGIRCEKAIIEMQNQGYENVYQLEGGILKYFEEIPGAPEWDGECFVFDRRVAIDKNLKTSQNFTFCPHCGQPATVEVNCIRCQKRQKLCEKCLASEDRALHTCSKNCAHHERKSSRVKRKNQGLTRQEMHRLAAQRVQE